MKSILFRGPKRFAAALTAVIAITLAAPSPAAAQASLTYLPSGLTTLYVSADGSTIAGYEGTSSGLRAFVFRGGNVIPLSLGGKFSLPSGVSGDGKIVVGSAEGPDGLVHAFFWNDGDEDATPLLPESLASTANGISTDGSTIIGTEFTLETSTGFVLRGTQKTSVTFQGSGATLFGVSANGTTVVGSVVPPGDANDKAIIWRFGDAEATLIPLTGDTLSMATGVSADGSTVIGSKSFAAFNHAFVWRVGSAAASFVDLNGGETTAYSVSANGSTVVGDGLIGANNIRGFAWRNGTVEVLAPPAGRQYSTALAVSADGTRIVGSALNDETNTVDSDSRDAVVWDGSAGPKFVKDLLSQNGVQVGAARLRTPTGASSDGKVVVGDTFLRSVLPDGSFSDLFGSFSAVVPLSQHQLTPAEMIEDLIDDVQALRLSPLVSLTLVLELRIALVATEHHLNFLSVALLNDFVREVKALRGKKIPTAAANELIADAQAIIAKLR